MNQAIAYLRQSTVKQERSGLGIEAQRKTVNDYARSREWSIVAEYVETESGRNNDRPKLREALSICRDKGYTLIISSLSRLSRNAGFLISLRDSGADFVCCDLPMADKFSIGIHALLVSQEADLISQRTTAALQAKKRQCEAKGLPWWQGQAENARRVWRKSVEVRKENAALRLSERRDAILAIYEGSGQHNFALTCRVLNGLRVPTMSGAGKWYPASVARVVLADDGAAS